MEIERKNIIEVLSGDSELVRLLPSIDDLAIVEYDGKNIDCSCAIAQYMEENDIDVSIVNRIVLLGKKTSQKSINERKLSEFFPNADITIVNKPWQETEPTKLKLWNTLVIHIGITIGISDYKFEERAGNGDYFVNFVNKTRVAYYACLLHKQETLFFENPYVTKANLRLNDFALEASSEENVRTNFCKDKQDYIENCINVLSEKDAFFQCFEEAEHGCEECNQCGNYGYRKQCPFAQRVVAKYYRDGTYVPQNERIAHQWEVMAARQDYKPAKIQVADDEKDGCGCNKNVEEALATYFSYASQIGNEHCINQILSIADEYNEINPIVAIPFVAKQAQDGNEDMIIKLSDAFQNATYGLPKDMVQQKEWIQQGAENGNPRFVLAMAEMYEDNRDWKESYNWYKTLGEVAPELLDDSKMDEIELKMLTNGATPDKVAVSGENYLFGYYGTSRDLHLAFRCLKYASDNNVASAKGLLGLMYLKGWDVEEDFETAIGLLTSAAENDDLFSMDKLTDLLYAEDNDYSDGYRWENIVVDKIEEQIAKEVPFAYYLKGCYCSTGYQYEDDCYEAFDNIKKAAELGLPKAQFKLSEFYSSGTGCPMDDSEANRWLQKAAENGYYKAEGKYGIQLFETADFFNSKKRIAFPYLRNAYEQGYTETYWCLAQCYMFGYGTTVNKEIAYPLYQKAAEEGIRDAQELLSEKYFKGDAPLPQDYTLCAKWGEEAIKQGSRSIRFETAYSSSHIGNHDRAKELYLELSNEGNGAAMNNYACELSDAKEKAEWFLKAADNGDDYGYWNIGKYYKNGTGVEKDIDKAIECLTKAADKGHTGAMKDLAQMYRNGDGVEQNGELAVKWYEKAAEKEDIDSILALADIYSKGNIVTQDKDKAVHYYKLAAEKDNSTALFKLGELYEYGICVEQNIHKAVYWYRKAANKGHFAAKESLKRLNSNWLNEDGNVDADIDNFEE